jgi:hypothetical protein
MARTDMPPEGVREHLGYNPETGKIVHLKKTHAYGGMRYPGDEAGTNKYGYISVGYRGVFYLAHRLAWYLMTGDWLPSKQDIDHINGDRADNRWCNLRLATRSQNMMNIRNLRIDNKSGAKGVSFRSDTQKWHARITVKGNHILLGDYEEKADAISARAEAEMKYFGKYGRDLL